MPAGCDAAAAARQTHDPPTHDRCARPKFLTPYIGWAASLRCPSVHLLVICLYTLFN